MPTADANALILHHYDMSPYSERVRILFGIKGLSWFGCDQPMILPKEDLVALTGGYRRIPVLQIGADLYFDSLFMIEEIDRRFPKKPAFAGIGPGFGAQLSHWCDDWSAGSYFMSIVMQLLGGDLPMPPEFLKDRSALMGAPVDPEQLSAMAPVFKHQLRGHLSLIEAQLADSDGPFLCGETPNMTDASLYFPLWFMQLGPKTSAQIDEFPLTKAWRDRVAAIGHGASTAIEAKDAIELARAAEPVAPLAGADCAPGDPQIGAAVKVKYNDANTPALEGVLAGAGLRHVSVRYESPQAGTLMLHMPRSAGAIMAG